MKRMLRAVTALCLCASLGGCASSGTDTTVSSAAPAAEEKEYKIGIVQLVQHPALDAATEGFMDVLKEDLGLTDENFDLQNASGDSAQCTPIVTQFLNEKVDLILANATPALIAASSATNSTPILGTAVTEYGTALGISDFSGTVGGNISGTSDLAPLDQQAAMFDELLPDAKTIGILYCNAEPNSVYQANVVQAALEAAGKTVSIYTFTDSNDVASVTKTACDECDALYIPTDNTAASCTEAINNVAGPAKTPIIAGEEGIMSGCGIATLSISYYELGRTTGKMAVKILKGEANISDMPIEYYGNPVKEYMPDRCEELGISIPDSYTAFKAE